MWCSCQALPYWDQSDSKPGLVLDPGINHTVEEHGTALSGSVPLSQDLLGYFLEGLSVSEKSQIMIPPVQVSQPGVVRPQLVSQQTFTPLATHLLSSRPSLPTKDCRAVTCRVVEEPFIFSHTRLDPLLNQLMPPFVLEVTRFSDLSSGKTTWPTWTSSQVLHQLRLPHSASTLTQIGSPEMD